MDPFKQQNTNSNRQNQATASPFAKALAETERPLGEPAAAATGQNDLLREAMARANANPSANQNQEASNQQPDINDQFNPLANQILNEQNQAELIKKQKKEALRRRLHDQINPTETHSVFDGQAQRTKEELEKTRHELKQLAREIEAFRKDIGIELDKELREPGFTGDYYVSFFEKLRSFIMLLRQKVKSARTWSQQMQAKQAKKKRKKTPGMVIDGAGHEQTKTVFDIMHQERSSTYGGS